jgi:hypothetical protein
MSNILATQRTVNAIRKADALPNSIIPDSDNSRKAGSGGANIAMASYGNIYVAVVKEVLSPGVYSVILQDADINGSSEAIVNTFDIIYGHCYYPGQRILVVETMVTTKPAVGEE